MFDRGFLMNMRRRALRRRVWYKVLDDLERGIVSLAAQVVDRVESVVLGVVLVKIGAKLKRALTSDVVRLMYEYGIEKARQFSDQAVEWGNRRASSWVSDHAFTRYLAVLEYYKPTVFGF